MPGFNLLLFKELIGAESKKTVTSTLMTMSFAENDRRWNAPCYEAIVEIFTGYIFNSLTNDEGIGGTSR